MDDKFEMKRKNFPEDIPEDMLEFTFCGAYRNVDFSGYESPIQVFENDLGTKITQEIEHAVFRKVMKLGVSIDKDKLMRALEYDRNQYAEGYNQGYRAGLEAARSAAETYKRERDAAIRDWKQNKNSCFGCKHFIENGKIWCRLPIEQRQHSFLCWEWRGVEVE